MIKEIDAGRFIRRTSHVKKWDKKERRKYYNIFLSTVIPLLSGQPSLNERLVAWPQNFLPVKQTSGVYSADASQDLEGRCHCMLI